MITNAKEVVVAVMGKTGVGKSSFIHTLTNDARIRIGHGLSSETSKVESYAFVHNQVRYTLVDTPGFDDTYTNDDEIVARILLWLKDSFDEKRLLNGIVYIHRLNEPRMSGRSLANLRMFRRMCGNEALKNVILAHTFWEGLSSSVLELRQQALEQEDDYWKKMIAKGSRVMKLAKDDKNSAITVLEAIVGNNKLPLNAQTTMQHTSLKATVAEMMQEAHVIEFNGIAEQVLNGIRSANMKKYVPERRRAPYVHVPTPTSPNRMRFSSNLDQTSDMDDVFVEKSKKHKEEMSDLQRQLSSLERQFENRKQTNNASFGSDLKITAKSGKVHKNTSCNHRPSMSSERLTCHRCGTAVDKPHFYHCCKCSVGPRSGIYLLCHNCGPNCRNDKHDKILIEPLKKRQLLSLGLIR